MKKKLVTLTALAVTAMMAFTGCGGGSSSNEDADNGADSASGAVEQLTLGTGGTTGTYYAVGGTMSTVLNNAMENVNLKVVSTGASKANILDIDDKVSDIAIVQNDVMYYAFNGTDLFEADGSFDTFSAIAGVYDETCQIIASTDIKSIEDLKGKRINVGDAGSGVEFNATQILAAYGIDINSDITKVNGSFGDAADSIKDGKIDAAFITAGAPTTAVVDLAISKDINLLTIDDEHAEALMSEYPFYTKTIIPGGTYSAVADDVQTLSVRATLITANDVTEDAIYELTKALFENKDALANSNAKFEELDPNAATQGISVPFHPGAEKYFKEIGVLS
ncbi:TAXI family TRAP transporter solute-binding subunit [Anaerotignum sp. MB30-C6]|uniref:TAXI family TRAP transporter solute-binding subunit n=1 Tax=Anaerotignum sp. MB30-C6 TaxID=3070814 RepID=UPI0027DC9F7F|nr:TAXI family TRAP transporter solute-binding subunit [Anaerotignum sp. MB30-C6]WMI81439.1 TAXI family TRAP transporter solute-binding subunit [Anaerotignum sp. MB30-C6]